MSDEEQLKRELAELKSQLEAEKAKSRQGIHLKVSQKGGVSLYGIRRFPITFYLDEWIKIFDMQEEIRAFLSEHEGELTTKS